MILLLILWLLLLGWRVAVGAWTAILAGLLLLIRVAALILLRVEHFFGLLRSASGTSTIVLSFVISLALVLVGASGTAVALMRVIVGSTLVVHFNFLVHVHFAPTYCLLATLDLSVSD